MKNIFKLCVPAAVLAMLLFAGCNNLFNPLALGEGDGMLRISVSSDSVNARTLYPTANFSRYVLSFHGPSSYSDVELTSGQNSVNISGLTPGWWTIEARGFVVLNGYEYEAAYGSVYINILAATNQNINIPISASMHGADGFFSYNVSLPGQVTWAELSLQSLWGWGDHNFDLLDDPSGKLELPPGYYLMRIRAENEFQVAGRTEIVHIYSYKETMANFVFTDADFAPAITLSGTIDITGASFFGIAALIERNGNIYMLGWDEVETGNTWSIRIPASNTPITISFGVEAYVNGDWYEKWPVHSMQVSNQNVSNINIGAVNVVPVYITLSGTLDLTVNGLTPDYMWLDVGVGDDEDYEWFGEVEVEPDGSWSITIQAFDNDTEVHFGVNGSFNGNNFNNPGVTRTVRDTDISDIHISVHPTNVITIGGTVDFISSVDIPWFGIQVRLANGQWVGSDYSGGNTWSIMLEAFDTDTTLYFNAHGGRFFNGSYEEFNTPIGSATVRNSSVNNINLIHDFGDPPPITLSGTVNFNIIGNVPDYIEIWAYTQAGPSQVTLGYTTVNPGDTTWSMNIMPLSSSRTVQFNVLWGHDGQWNGVSPDVERTVWNTSVPNINLGTIDIVQYMNLEGFVNVNIFENGNPYGDWYNAWVYAYSDPGFQNQVGWADVQWDGSWSMHLSARTLYFAIEVNSNIGWTSQEIDITWTPGSSTWLDLGTVNVNFNTGSGGDIILEGHVSVNITENGNPYHGHGGYHVYVNAYSDPDFYYNVAQVQVDNWGNWSMSIPSWFSSGTLYFAIGVNSGLGWAEQDTGSTWAPGNSTWIDFGTVNVNYGNGGDIFLEGHVSVDIFDKDGNPYYGWYDVLVHAYSDPNFYDHVIGVYVDNWGSWSMSIPPSWFSSGTLYFTIHVESGLGGYTADQTGVTWTVGDNPYVNFGTVGVQFGNGGGGPGFMLNGHVNVNISLDGSPFSGDFSAYVEAYFDPDLTDWANYGNIDSDGNWSMYIPDWFSGTLYFTIVVGVELPSGSRVWEERSTGVTWIPGDDTEINLGNNFNFDFITLGGTLTIYDDGVPAGHSGNVYLVLFNHPSMLVEEGSVGVSFIGSNPSSWSMLIQDSYMNQPLYFGVFWLCPDYEDILASSPAGNIVLNGANHHNITLTAELPPMDGDGAGGRSMAPASSGSSAPANALMRQRR
jgi:hypothetical protein